MKTVVTLLTGPDLSSHELLQGFHTIPSRDLLTVPNIQRSNTSWVTLMIQPYENWNTTVVEGRMRSVRCSEA